MLAQLQDYLHKLISDHQLASSATVLNLLALLVQKYKY
jgi:hypothetical protein